MERGNRQKGPLRPKAVSEWFPNRERALAIVIFDSIFSIAGAIAPSIVLWIYLRRGWRPAFKFPGLVEFVGLIAWRCLYYPPEAPPRISEADLRVITADKPKTSQAPQGRLQTPWRELLKRPQARGTIAAKSFTDPVLFLSPTGSPLIGGRVGPVHCRGSG